MRQFWSVPLAALLVWASSLPVMAGGFEGVVAYKMTTSGKTVDMEFMVKGQKVRSEMQQGGMKMSMIMDPSGKKVTTLMHKQKMYSTTTLDSSMTGKAAKTYDGKFYKASGSKTILGYKCEHWVHEGKAGKGDFWLAKGIGAFAGMGGGQPGRSKLEDWVKAVQAEGLFTLEMDYKTKDGKTMNMVATKVEKKSLSADLFQPPADYKKMPSWDGASSSGERKQPSAEDVMKGMAPKLPF